MQDTQKTAHPLAALRSIFISPLANKLLDEAASLIDSQAQRIAELEAQLAALRQGVPPESEAIAEIISAGHADAEFGERGVRFLRDFSHLEYGTKLYAHPTQQGLDAQAIDAQRWQIVHNRISGEYIAGRACFVVQISPVPEANIMRGSVAEHFTKAVDFVAAQAKQGGVDHG